MNSTSIPTVRALQSPLSSSPIQSSSPSPIQSSPSPTPSPQVAKTTATDPPSPHKTPTTPTIHSSPKKTAISIKPGDAHATGFSSPTTDASPNNTANGGGGGGGGGKAKLQNPVFGDDGVGNGGGDASGQSSAPTTTDGRNDASSNSSNSGVTGTTDSGISLTPSGMASATPTTTAITPFFSTSNSPTNGNTPVNAENDPGTDNAGSGPAVVSGGNVNGDAGEPAGNGRSSGFGNANGGLGSENTNGSPSSGGLDSGNTNDGPSSGGLGSGNTNGGPSSGNKSPSSGGPTFGSRTGSGNGGTSTPGMTSAAVVDNGNTISTGGVQEHGLSGGAIAGTVIAALVGVIAVIVILLRRRSRKRRGERRNRWWSSHDKVDGGIGRNSGIPDEHRRSARSSFETTVDHSLTPRLGEDFDAPSIPPMAELRGTPLLVRLDTSVGSAPQSYSPSLKGRVISENRFSGATVSSIGSDGQAQWLVIGEDPLAPQVSSPMSVRPFSPTESFAFPKPPTEKNSSEWGLNLSRSSSGVPALPVRAANPFNDPDPFIIYSTPAVTNSLTTDPFADPEPSTTSNNNNNNNRVGSFDDEFMEIERIKRSFDPSLDDELGVVPGDKVRILQIFSDGWAMVEKNPSSGLVDVKGKGRESEQGLIPIECLRLPVVASERVNS